MEQPTRRNLDENRTNRLSAAKRHTESKSQLSPKSKKPSIRKPGTEMIRGENFGFDKANRVFHRKRQPVEILDLEKRANR